MILDLKKIRAKGKEEESFFFEYTPENQLLDMPNGELLTPVKISGEITLTDRHSAYVEGEITFTLEGECTRCLKQTSKKYSAFFAEQLEQGSDEGYPLVNDKIDLSKIVEDAILINMPVSFLCKEDCKGMCFNCGANLNDEKCKCNN